MELPPDELAGVVDIVGPVTRRELVQACGELAFKRGGDMDTEAVEATIERAISSYQLVVVSDHDAADTPLILVGPAAFPDIPEGAEDLPHILDLPSRELGRETVATGAEQRFREDAAEAVRAGDDDRIAELLDVSYDLEAWGPVALASARALLDEATHAN